MHFRLAVPESESENQRLLAVRITPALEEVVRRHQLSIVENMELQAKLSIKMTCERCALVSYNIFSMNYLHKHILYILIKLKLRL